MAEPMTAFGLVASLLRTQRAGRDVPPSILADALEEESRTELAFCVRRFTVGALAARYVELSEEPQTLAVLGESLAVMREDMVLRAFCDG